jgi:hypothetical protein
MRILVWWLRSVKPKSIPPGPRSLIRLHNDSHDHHACGECVSEGQDYGYRFHDKLASWCLALPETARASDSHQVLALSRTVVRC